MKKYLTTRALGLHLALIVWLSMCIAASWWQVGRAFQGNSLSYLYSVEWPGFGILGFFGWWALLHQEKVTEHHEIARREYEAKMRAEAMRARAAEAQDEDAALKAYNDHLAQLNDPQSRQE